MRRARSRNSLMILVSIMICSCQQSIFRELGEHLPPALLLGHVARHSHQDLTIRVDVGRSLAIGHFLSVVGASVTSQQYQEDSLTCVFEVLSREVVRT